MNSTSDVKKMDAEKMFESRIFSGGFNKAYEEFVHNPSYTQWSNKVSILQRSIRTPKSRGLRKRLKLSICKKSVSRNHKLQSRSNSESLFDKFLNDAPVYTLNRIGGSKSMVLKIVWLIIMIIAVIGCVSQIGQFLAAYYSYPVVVNLESHKAESLNFPSVTLCNLNNVKREYETCFKQKLTYDECLNRTDKPKLSHPDNFPEPECDAEMRKSYIQNNSEPSWFQLLVSHHYDSRVRYGHQAKNFISSCTFEDIPCSFEDFELHVSYIYGNCYTFNSVKEKVISHFAGPLGGLNIELDLEVDTYATFTSAVGARLLVHDPFLEPDVDDKGIIVSPGSEYHVAVTKSLFSRLPAPYKDHCKHYSLKDGQANCIQLCLHKLTLSKCHCSVMKNLYRTTRRCDLTNVLVLCCIKKYNREELCKCPLPCEDIHYDVEVSSASWPSEMYFKSKHLDLFETNKTDYELQFKKIKQNRMRLRIFYDSLKYMTYKQSPAFESSEVLSQIGGQIGLWLGMSLVAAFGSIETAISLWIFKKKP